MRIDAHFHMDTDLLAQWQKQEMKGLMNCATEKEYAYGKQLQKTNTGLSLSCGIHPWNVEETTWEAMFPCLQDCSIIGEIGMDSVWCKCDLTLQRSLFERQLAYASNLHKPVVLHTKGQEQQVAKLLTKYPNTYLVHWYSCMEHLDAYLALSPFFTIGPSVALDPSVQQVVTKVDCEHLLVESDGIAAISWAYGHTMDANAYADVLDDITAYIANIKHQSFAQMQAQLIQNYERFLKGI